MEEHNLDINQTVSIEGGEVLTFSVNDAIYGIEIKYVKDIIAIEQITIIPKIPSHIKGVINIRGKVVPVISVRRRFGMEEIPYDDRTCIIVLEFSDSNQVGIIVDRVQEVITIKSADVSKTPDSKNVNANRYIKSIINIDSGIKLLIDCDKLINDDGGML